MDLRRKLIRAARLIDGKREKPLLNQAIVIENGLIQSIQPWQDNAYPDAELINRGDVTLLPGFIDTHVHLTFNPHTLRYYDSTKSQAETTLIGVGNAQAILRAGVTTVCDVGAENEIVFALRETIKNGNIVGPRVLSSGYAITISNGHGNHFGKIASGVDEVRRAVIEQIEAGADLIKVMATGGGMALVGSTTA